MSFLERKLNQLTKKSKKALEAQSDSCHYFLEPVIDDHGTWSDTLLLKEVVTIIRFLLPHSKNFIAQDIWTNICITVCEGIQKFKF